MSDSIKGGVDFKKLQELFVLLQQYGPNVFEFIQKLAELLQRPSLKVAGDHGDDCCEVDHLDEAIDAQISALAALLKHKHGSH